MKIIGITGSIASGKTTVANLMAKKNIPYLVLILWFQTYIKKKNLIKF